MTFFQSLWLLWDTLCNYFVFFPFFFIAFLAFYTPSSGFASTGEWFCALLFSSPCFSWVVPSSNNWRDARQRWARSPVPWRSAYKMGANWTHTLLYTHGIITVRLFGFSELMIFFSSLLEFSLLHRPLFSFTSLGVIFYFSVVKRLCGMWKRRRQLCGTTRAAEGYTPHESFPLGYRMRMQVHIRNFKDLSRVGGEEEGWVVFIHCILSTIQRREV